jgi:hypothetical protein
LYLLSIPFSTVVYWKLKEQCCLTVSVCFRQFSCNIFAYRTKASKPNVSFNLHVVYMNLIIYIITCISCVSTASRHFNSRYAAMFRLVLGCLISDAYDSCDFRASEIRNLILYSFGILFIFRWLILREKKGPQTPREEQCRLQKTRKQIS